MACRWQPGIKITALLDALNSALAEPFALAWVSDSPRFLLVFTVAYAVAVTQIGSIFITNAIAHTKEDTTIEICCNLLKNNVVEIGVHDYGQGIAEKDLPRIFERFYRADPSRTTNGHYGLGLSVAKSLAEQQSLHIGARNTPGGGAMFYICTQ